MEGSRDATGEPTYLIFDAARNRYFHIGWHAFEILVRWDRGTRSALRESLTRDLDIEIDDQEIDGLIRFLDSQELTVDGVRTGWRRSLEHAAARRTGVLAWLIHNYLFFRIPLLRPDAWLARASRVTSIVFTRVFWIGWVCVTVAAFYLSTRSWSEFALSWQRVFALQGVVAFAAGLAAMKSIHELGHAVVARRLGCRVATIGVTFMVLAPFLYTDTTDCWRLPSRLHRWRVASAGVLAELTVAPLALLIWVFMPQGFPRDLMFAAAVLAPAVSIVVNVNPFMRFDGYFMLADALGIYNLQPRSFAFARWRLREALFAHGAPPPEQLPDATARTMTTYGYLVWLYRLPVFVGIAVFVYVFTFKILGLVLFAIEIGFFVLRPIVNELKIWWRMRKAARIHWKSALLLGAGCLGIVALAVPWHGTVAVPALVESGHLAAIHTPAPGRIAEILVRNGDTVAVGQPLIRLQAPELETREAIAVRRIALLDLRLARIAGSAEELDESTVLRQEREAEGQTLVGIRRLRDDLVVKAPIGGVVLDLDKDLRVGMWLSPRHQIATVADPSTTVLRGFVAQADIGRVRPGMTGMFVGDDGIYRFAKLRLESLNGTADRRLSIPVLAEPFGGRIEATIDEKKAVYSREAMFGARMVLESGETVPHSIAGVARIDGDPESFLPHAIRRVLRVMLQESGF